MTHIDDGYFFLNIASVADISHACQRECSIKQATINHAIEHLMLHEFDSDKATIQPHCERASARLCHQVKPQDEAARSAARSSQEQPGAAKLGDIWPKFRQNYGQDGAKLEPNWGQDGANSGILGILGLSLDILGQSWV